MEDVSRNIDIGQYGGMSGVGTEHMIVCLYVIMTSLDWAEYG